MSEPSTVWAVVPGGCPQAEAVTAEMLGEARRLAGGGEAVVLAVGSMPDSVAESFAPLGAQRVLVIDRPELSTYHPELAAAAVAAAVGERAPAAVLFAGTTLGRDLGLRVSLLLGRRFLAGCVNFELIDGGARATRPVEGGKRHATERAEGRPALLSLVPDTVGAEAPSAGATAPVEAVEIELGAVRPALRDHGFAPGDPRTMDIRDADVIVSGGRGVGSAEAFALLAQVADHLGGTLGASRPAVEAGWAPYARQVGQTGQTVTPKLYVACGISGATQHLAGMRDAQTIIAINTDSSAPIFSVATLGVEGDLHEVLEALLELLGQRSQAVAA